MNKGATFAVYLRDDGSASNYIFDRELARQGDQDCYYTVAVGEIQCQCRFEWRNNRLLLVGIQWENDQCTEKWAMPARELVSSDLLDNVRWLWSTWK